jgi:hypothetical protein
MNKNDNLTSIKKTYISNKQNYYNLSTSYHQKNMLDDIKKINYKDNWSINSTHLMYQMQGGGCGDAIDDKDDMSGSCGGKSYE